MAHQQPRQPRNRQLIRNAIETCNDQSRFIVSARSFRNASLLKLHEELHLPTVLTSSQDAEKLSGTLSTLRFDSVQVPRRAFSPALVQRSGPTEGV